MDSVQKILVDSASLAPSGDNTQPWRFAFEPAASGLKIVLDPTRDPSPMNAGQRMARIALGAAAENVQVAAQHNRWQAVVRNSGDVVGISIDGLSSGSAAVPEVLRQRVTNRRNYDGRTVPTEVRAEWERSIELPAAVRAKWIVERSSLSRCAPIVGTADSLMFGLREIRQAFLKNIRFDQPAAERVQEGLSLSSLELNFVDRIGLRLLGLVSDGVFRFSGMGAAFQKKSARLVETASGLVALVTSQTDSETDVEVGICFERIWLHLTALGYAVQPMMSVPVLDNLRLQGYRSLNPKFGKIVQACEECFATAGEERIAALLRFGRAPDPSGRTGRRLNATS